MCLKMYQIKQKNKPKQPKKKRKKVKDNGFTMLSSVIQFHEIPNQFEITLMNCMEPFCLYILDVLDKVQKKKKKKKKTAMSVGSW